MTKSPQPHILLIDDDVSYAQLLSHHLEKRGILVTICSSGHAGIAQLARLRPTMILLESRIPNISGMESLLEIRKSYSKDSLPVIMLTPAVETEMVATFFDAGANDCISRASSLAVVMARIASQLHILDLVQDRVRAREIFAITALVASFNHEINTPLGVALGNLARLERGLDVKVIEKIRAALIRIRDVVVQSRDLGGKLSIEYEEYHGKQMMIRLPGK